MFGGLAERVEVPVQGCNVAWFLERGASGAPGVPAIHVPIATWPAYIPLSASAPLSARAHLRRAAPAIPALTNTGAGVTEEAPVVYSSVPVPAASMAGNTARVAVIAP